MRYSDLHVYPNSVQKRGDSEFFISAFDNDDLLIVAGSDMQLFEGEEISAHDKVYKQCPLSVENSKIIRQLFNFTNPVSHKERNITIGLGDRLGLASVGHIRLLRNLNVFPVLAQQSMRELNLTGRTYEDVLSAAVWAVFKEGYTKGYGADGDHLKTNDEVKYAIDCGFSMITLDCSEYIPNDLISASQAELNERYAAISPETTSTIESLYLDKNFIIDEDIEISFSDGSLRFIVLEYLPAINHAVSIFNEFIKNKNIDFEISIDETSSTTTPQAHFFVANELIRRGVDFTSLAPRFIGEFQKGIDYRGEISEFESDFNVHVKIAEKFSYKISVHSGSDKFSIFPIVGDLTKGKYHLKTAGTNWLEAVRVIAKNNPKLYREIHIFALSNLSEAKKYYHITENIARIAKIDTVSDDALPDFLDQDDARQVLHITYGLILQAKADNGSSLYRDRIYECLKKYEPDYYIGLEKHIGRHLTCLGIGISDEGTVQ